jgi:putative alpha-1,2-mannosidase
MVSNSNSLMQFTGYSSKRSIFSPSYFKTFLYGYSTSKGNTILEFSPTSHGGIMQVQFPDYDQTIQSSQSRRISIVLNGDSDFSSVQYKGLADSPSTVMISGYSKANSGGVGDDNSAFAHYFVAFVYLGPQGNKPSTFTRSEATANGAFVDFDGTNPLNNLLTVRFATSFISIDQALVSLEQEVGLDKTFDDVRVEAKSKWNSALSRIKIEEVSKDYSPAEASNLYKTFYSCLYRASLFPRLLTETAADGSLVHWSPYASSSETRVMPGHLSADSGFWDAYSTVYPGLTLWNRPMLTNLLNGWVNSYKEGKWLVKWASPGFRTGMGMIIINIIYTTTTTIIIHILTITLPLPLP